MIYYENKETGKIIMEYYESELSVDYSSIVKHLEISISILDVKNLLIDWFSYYFFDVKIVRFYGY